jgi:hypothetical protein
VSKSLGLIDSGAPDRRLADTRLPLDDEDLEAVCGRSKHIPNHRELGISADDGCGHAVSLDTRHNRRPSIGAATAIDSVTAVKPHGDCRRLYR